MVGEREGRQGASPKKAKARQKMVEAGVSKPMTKKGAGKQFCFPPISLPSFDFGLCARQKLPVYLIQRMVVRSFHSKIGYWNTS